MKFSTATLVSALLCAEATLAAPASAKSNLKSLSKERRLARRGAGIKQSRPKIASETSSNKTFVEYSENWAGAVLVSTGYTSVTAEVTVPSASGTDTGYAAWVGIDGDTCDTAILQTGYDFSGGEYSAWYEWYPAYSYDFDLTVAAGDTLKMTVTATSTTSGSAVIENLTTGQTVTETFTDVTDGALCEYNAEWIVEDFEECSDSGSCELVPFANFGTVEFTGASAVKNGATVGTTGATIMDIEQSKVLTSCSSTSSTVTCKYE